MWPKCRQCRPAFFPNLSEPSPAVGQCRQKKLDEASGFQAASADVPSAFSFCARSAGVDCASFSLKQQRCPRCGKIETLNRHSRSVGNDPLRASGVGIDNKPHCIRAVRQARPVSGGVVPVAQAPGAQQSVPCVIRVGRKCVGCQRPAGHVAIGVVNDGLAIVSCFLIFS